MAKRIPTDLLIDDLKRVFEKIGRAPSYEDMREHGKYYPATAQRRFGSWENAKRAIGWTPDYESYDPFSVSPADGSWLAGIIDGEGCFYIQKPSATSNKGLSKSYAPVFAISIRDDDGNIIDELQRILDIDVPRHIDHRDRPTSGPNDKPVIKVHIRNLPDLHHRLIPVLDKFPLRGKKIDDFYIFKITVKVLLAKVTGGRKYFGYTDDERDFLERLYRALREIKVYQSNLDDVIQKYNLHEIEQKYS